MIFHHLQAYRKMGLLTAPLFRAFALIASQDPEFDQASSKTSEIQGLYETFVAEIAVGDKDGGRVEDRVMSEGLGTMI